MTAALYVFPVTDTPPSPDDLLTAREVAALLGRSVDHVRKLLYSGALPGELDERDRNYRVRRADAEAYLAGRRGDPSPMFAELGAFAALIEATENLRDDLIECRNRAMLAWRDDRGATTVAIAAAAGMGRQNATDVLSATRARVRAQRPPQ